MEEECETCAPKIRMNPEFFIEGVGADEVISFLLQYNIPPELAQQWREQQPLNDSDGKLLDLRRHWKKFLYHYASEAKAMQLLDFYGGDHKKTLEAISAVRYYAEHIYIAEVERDVSVIEEETRAAKDIITSDFCQKYLTAPLKEEPETKEA